MLKYATREEKDRAREEWFATRDKRREENEAREARLQEALQARREWYDVDEQGRIGGKKAGG